MVKGYVWGQISSLQQCGWQRACSNTKNFVAGDIVDEVAPLCRLGRFVCSIVPGCVVSGEGNGDPSLFECLAAHHAHLKEVAIRALVRYRRALEGVIA